MVSVVVAIRHGLGLHNLSNRAAYKGDWEEHRRLRELINHDQYNSPLAEDGVEQARSLRPYLLSLIQFPWVEGFAGYVSPQPRAIQTAGELDLPLNWRVDKRIRERSKGELESTLLTADNFADIERQAKACVADPYCAPPGGESVAQRYTEFQEFMQEKDEQHPNQIVLLSSHGEMQRIMALVLEGKDLTEWPNFQFRVPNCYTFAYSRVNPETGEKSTEFRWKLAFCTYEGTPDLSWQPVL